MGGGSRPRVGGDTNQGCLETGKSVVQSIGVATNMGPSMPSLPSGQMEPTFLLNFSSTTGVAGISSRFACFAATHSIKFKWHSLSMRSVGLPAMITGSSLPGT